MIPPVTQIQRDDLTFRPTRALVLLILALQVIFTSLSYAADNPKRHVLLLQSYHHSFKWNQDIYSAIIDSLQPTDNNIELHVVHMDTKRITYTASYRRQLSDRLKNNYQQVPFDLIISSDNNAFDFLRMYRDQLFPGVPVIFCGVNDFKQEQLHGLTAFTGVAEKFAALDTVQAALDLQPQTRHIFVINDHLPTGKAWTKGIQKELAPLQPQLEISYAANSPMEELLNKVRALPEQSIILIGAYFSDSDNQYFSAQESIALIAEASSVPAYGLLDLYLGHGLTGGKLISGYYQGLAAAGIAKLVLAGQDASTLPVQLHNGNQFLFDHQQLQRYHLGSNLLPRGSVVINIPVSFYQTHKIIVWITGATLLVLISIIVALSQTILSKRRVESALRAAHHNLESQVDHRTKELRAQERDQRMLLENIPIRVFYKDKQSAYVACSSVFANDFGLQIHQVKGKQDRDLLPAEIADKYHRNDSSIMQKGLIQEHKGEYRTINETIQIHSIKAPMRNDQGEVIGLLGIFWDVTEQVAAQKALEASEARFRTLFQGSKSIQLLLNPKDGMIIDANKAAEQFYGYPRETLLAMSMDKINTLPSQELEAKLERVKRKEQDHFTFRHQLAGGEIRDVEVHAGPIEFLGRTLVYSIVHDITDRIQMELELRQAQKLESVGQLAAGIAHEINSPIQFIGDNLEFIQDTATELIELTTLHQTLLAKALTHTIDDALLTEQKSALADADLDYLQEELPAAIKQALEGTDRVTSLVRAMKEFSHPGATDMAEADINRAIGSTITMTGNEWKYSADLHTDLDPDLPPVPCLIGEFNQVILNLILNARDAIVERLGEGSTEKGNIAISTTRNDDFVEIKVSDNGNGMPSDVQSHIFDPFYTTKEVGKGSGQGLAISHSIIVGKHQGELLCQSEPGQGTTFTIRLPFQGPTSIGRSQV